MDHTHPKVVLANQTVLRSVDQHRRHLRHTEDFAEYSLPLCLDAGKSRCSFVNSSDIGDALDHRTDTSIPGAWSDCEQPSSVESGPQAGICLGFSSNPRHRRLRNV
jgi:hypothetical protein